MGHYHNSFHPWRPCWWVSSCYPEEWKKIKSRMENHGNTLETFHWKGRYDWLWYLFITKLIVVSNYHHYGANYSIWCLSRMKLTHREFQRNLNAKKEHLVCSKIKQEINFFLIFLAHKERTSTFSLIYMFDVWTESTSNIIRRSTWHERGRDAR